MFSRSSVWLLALFALTSKLAMAQTPLPAPTATQPEDKRIFWIIPNYRTSPSLHPYTPLTSQEKFKIASEDSFDRGTVALAVLFAGESQLTNSTPAFGQGVKGYARYLGTCLCGFRDWGHDDGSHLSCYASSRPALLSARDGYRLVAPRKCGRPDFLDPHGFREHCSSIFPRSSATQLQ